MDTSLQTFWQQLTRSAINKFLFWATGLLATVAGLYSLTGLDQPVDRLSARLIFASAFAIWALNILITWLHQEQRATRTDLTIKDGLLIALAGLGLAGTALVVAPWACVATVVATIWVAALVQPDTKLVRVNPMDATPRTWAIGLAAVATVLFGLGVVVGAAL